MNIKKIFKKIPKFITLTTSSVSFVYMGWKFYDY